MKYWFQNVSEMVWQILKTACFTRQIERMQVERYRRMDGSLKLSNILKFETKRSERET